MVKKTKKPVAKTPSGLASLARRRPPDREYDDIPDYPPEAYVSRSADPSQPMRPLPRSQWQLGDPDDHRTERYGMRIHPDLRAELEALAREQGFRLSQWIERALIDAVNHARGRDVLDRIGRRRTG